MGWLWQPRLWQAAASIVHRELIMLHRLLWICLALAASPIVQAAPPPSDVDGRQPFAEQRAHIERDLAGGEVYSELSPADLTQVRQALERMSGALGDGGINAVSPESRVAVFKDQELINGLLTRAREDSRMVCRREKVVGSNMPTNVCMTVAQRRQARNDAQRMIRENVRPMPKPNN